MNQHMELSSYRRPLKSLRSISFISLIHHQVANIQVLENWDLLQRLNSFKEFKVESNLREIVFIQLQTSRYKFNSKLQKYEAYRALQELKVLAYVKHEE